MRFMVCVNDGERLGNGDESTFEDIKYEISELLRTCYFDVEYMDECKDGE